MTDVHHQLFRTYEERAHIVRVCGIPVTIILSRISTIYCAPAALALTLRVNSTATAALFSRGCQVSGSCFPAQLPVLDDPESRLCIFLAEYRDPVDRERLETDCGKTVAQHRQSGLASLGVN